MELKARLKPPRGRPENGQTEESKSHSVEYSLPSYDLNPQVAPLFISIYSVVLYFYTRFNGVFPLLLKEISPANKDRAAHHLLLKHVHVNHFAYRPPNASRRGKRDFNASDTRIRASGKWLYWPRFPPVSAATARYWLTSALRRGTFHCSWLNPLLCVLLS